jgi:hypothetical protein
MGFSISDKLVQCIEENSKVIVERWSSRLKSDPTTASFTQKNIEYVQTEALALIGHLGKWVSYDTTKEEVGKIYAKGGMSYFNMRIPLCEVIRALYTLRRTLWLFIQNESCFDSALELHKMKDLNDRIILFFDRAQYYAIRGYMEEMNRKIKDLWKLKPEDTNKIFFEASFYKQ